MCGLGLLRAMEAAYPQAQGGVGFVMSSDPTTIIELPITDDLRNKCGVIRFMKEGPATLVLMCGGSSSANNNNNNNDDKNKKTTIIIFHVQKGGSSILWRTLKKHQKESWITKLKKQLSIVWHREYAQNLL